MNISSGSQEQVPEYRCRGSGTILSKGAVEGAEKGIFEAVTGGLKAAAGGITVAIGWGYLIAVIFNPKSVR